MCVCPSSRLLWAWGEGCLSLFWNPVSMFLAFPSWPFQTVSGCIMCRSAMGGAVRPLLRPLSPWYPCLGSGARFARPRTRSRGILYGVVRLSLRSPSLCTCAGGLRRGEGVKGGAQTGSASPFSSPPRLAPPPSPAKGAPAFPSRPLPPCPAPSATRRRTPRG